MQLSPQFRALGKIATAFAAVWGTSGALLGFTVGPSAIGGSCCRIWLPTNCRRAQGPWGDGLTNNGPYMVASRRTRTGRQTPRHDVA